MEFIRMIRTANHRSACHVHESHLTRRLPVFVEFFRGHIIRNWQMTEAGLKVLPKCEDIAPCVAKILHGFEQFRLGFAEAEHDAGFGVNLSIAVFFHFSKYGE